MRGTNAVYCSIDPSTAITEVAVHKGLHVLDTQPHVLTCTVVSATAGVRVVQPDEIPLAQQRLVIDTRLNPG